MATLVVVLDAVDRQDPAGSRDDDHYLIEVDGALSDGTPFHDQANLALDQSESSFTVSPGDYTPSGTVIGTDGAPIGDKMTGDPVHIADDRVTVRSLVGVRGSATP